MVMHYAITINILLVLSFMNNKFRNNSNDFSVQFLSSLSSGFLVIYNILQYE